MRELIFGGCSGGCNKRGVSPGLRLPYPVEINCFFTKRLSVLTRNGRGRRQRGNGRHGTALNGSRLNPGPTWDVGAVTKNGSRCQISECAVLLSDSAARRCVLSENTSVSFWGRSVPPLTRLCNYEKAVFCYRTWMCVYFCMYYCGIGYDINPPSLRPPSSFWKF